MPKGALYVRLFYPGFIGIKKGTSYVQNVEGRAVSLLVKKHLRPVEILDFGNKLECWEEGGKHHVKLKENNLPISDNTIQIALASELLCVLDYEGLYSKLYRPRSFTEVLVAYEIDSAPSYNEEELNFHQKAVDAFLSRYRHLTHHVGIRLMKDLRRDVPVVQVAAVEYDADDLTLAPEDRLQKDRSLSFGVKQMSFGPFLDDLPHVNHNVDEITTKMQSSLPVSKTQETLLKAFEQLTVNHNPQYALLIAFIAAEVLLGYYLHEAKVKRGASKTKLDDYEEEVPFSYKLNIELPVLLGNIDENDRQTIAAVDKVRKKRNSIVHRGEDVSIEEALSAINAVGQLHDMLGKRPI